MKYICFVLAAFTCMHYFRCVISDVIEVRILETESSGFEVTAVPGCSQCSVKGTQPASLREFFRLGPNCSLLLNKPLDLEYIYDKENTVQVTVQLYCGNVLRRTVHLAIEPVNEFKPFFIKPPFSVQIPEDTVVGTSVFSLNDRVQDRDLVRYGNITRYRFVEHLIHELDGQALFNIDTTTGTITTNGVFDYEGSSRHFWYLNVAAEDDGGLSSTTSVTVDIFDVDDMPPVFVRTCVRGEECTQQPYKIEIDVHFHGEVTHMTSSLIHARDGDTGVNASIIYTIRPDSGEELFGNNLAMDNMTGELRVLTPFINITNDETKYPIQVSFNVTATEDTLKRSSTQATVLLYVYLELPTTPTATPSTTPTATQRTNATADTELNNSDDSIDDTTLLLIETLIPCIVVVIILAVFIGIVFRKKQRAKEKKYNVRDGKIENRPESVHDATVDTLSSTMINPYELVNAYAHIEMGERDAEDQPEDGLADQESSPTKAVEDVVGETDIALSYDESLETDPETDMHLYSKVEKRKQRKRVVQQDDVDVGEQSEDEYNAEKNTDGMYW